MPYGYQSGAIPARWPVVDQCNLYAKTAQAAAGGNFELFKTSQHFDATAQHPEWLGPETDEVKKLGQA